jgi:hypothetical protein
VPQHYRHYYGRNNSGIYNLQWDAIRSFVVITASEGFEPSDDSGPPQRFVGDAFFSIHNVAPHQGGVTFRVEIGYYALVGTGGRWASVVFYYYLCGQISPCSDPALFGFAAGSPKSLSICRLRSMRSSCR